jgi:hypothetical protein
VKGGALHYGIREKERKEISKEKRKKERKWIFSF